MVELDDQLRDAFARAAEPGDPSGVADAIRSRVAAGDTGTPASSSGFGGSPLAWLPWIGVIVVGGLVGGLLGVTGAFGHPVQHVTEANPPALLALSTDARSCPTGSVVTTVAAGARVLLVARSDDSAQLGIRNPANLDATIWVPASVVVIDPDQADVATLPVGVCPTLTVPQPAPVVVPVTPVTPSTPSDPGNPPPPPPADTTPPSVGKVNVVWENCHFTVTTTVTDDVGVSSVSISWTGVHPGSGSMQNQGGGVWTFDLSGSNNVYGGNYTFTATATDGAGNSGSNQSPVTNIQCLI